MLARVDYATGPASILKPVDREALQALFRRLRPGDDPASFGAWSSRSVHLAGSGPHASFGVALRNGYAEPWVHGYRPRGNPGAPRSFPSREGSGDGR